MNPRDLKIAAIITLACLLLSFVATYSYARGWYWTSGVLPLALTVILVLLTTVIVESVTPTAKIAVAPLTGKSNPHRVAVTKAKPSPLFYVERLLSPLILLLVVTLWFFHWILQRSRKHRSSEILNIPQVAHS